MCEPKPGENLFMGEETKSSSLGSFWITAARAALMLTLEDNSSSLSELKSNKKKKTNLGDNLEDCFFPRKTKDFAENLLPPPVFDMSHQERHRAGL